MPVFAGLKTFEKGSVIMQITKEQIEALAKKWGAKFVDLWDMQDKLDDGLSKCFSKQKQPKGKEVVAQLHYGKED